MTRALVVSASKAPALVAAVGERASYRFFEFFTEEDARAHDITGLLGGARSIFEGAAGADW